METGMTGGRWVSAGAVAIAVTGVSIGAGAEPRAVIELFTSQGCSSCPAADKLLGELTKDPSLVTISVPIDYWDYLGWKDTLAVPGHTARQKAYSKARGDRDVYTPQVVVNGVAQALGSDKAAIERAVAQSHHGAATLSVPISVSVAGGHVTISASAGKADAKLSDVWLCPISKTVSVEIGRGENRGHTITYTNVVRGWHKLGTWTGAAETWTVPVAEITGDHADAIAVLIQSGSSDKPGQMLGAAIAAIP
jgi:hypothetical protein